MLKALKNITKVFLILISIIVLGGLVNALSGHEESPEMKKLHAENSERIKARMQSMNLNVLGGTTSEDRLELMNEQDSLDRKSVV